LLRFMLSSRTLIDQAPPWRANRAPGRRPAGGGLAWW